MQKKVIKFACLTFIILGIVISIFNFTAAKTDAKDVIWGTFKQDIVDGQVVGEICSGVPSSCVVIIMPIE